MSPTDLYIALKACYSNVTAQWTEAPVVQTGISVARVVKQTNDGGAARYLYII